MWTPNTLDIVVPAYKGRFLPALLQSLARQSSKNFRVIISDDASPEPLHGICEQFKHQLNVRYVRFENNLGSADLAAHWNRSVALSDAQWVLLPGDDDVLGENCIEAFWETARAWGHRFDMFSFGVRVIDEKDGIIREQQAAEAASAAEFLRKRLAEQVNSVTVGYIFSRQVFEHWGGFVSFDRGWHTDDATWALFAAARGIRPIERAFVGWRLSSINISPGMRADCFRSSRTTVAFLSWLLCNQTRLGISDGDLQQLGKRISWRLYSGLAAGQIGRWTATAWQSSLLLGRTTSTSFLRHLLRFARARMARFN